MLRLNLFLAGLADSDVLLVEEEASVVEAGGGAASIDAASTATGCDCWSAMSYALSDPARSLYGKREVIEVGRERRLRCCD